MKELFKKISCRHHWEVHDKNEVEWSEKNIVENTFYWFKPLVNISIHREITEVLICKKCGKIKVVKY